MTTTQYKALAPSEGMRLQSGPGRDLIFKVTGEDTGCAFDYFVVQIALHGGPPLHIHHGLNPTRSIGPRRRHATDARSACSSS